MSHRNMITEPAQALEYLTAGNATVTLVSRKSGSRFTYKVRAPEAGSDIRFVGLLSGPDNDASYTYMGILKDAEGTLVDADHPAPRARWSFRSTAKSRINVAAPSWRAFAWVLHQLQKNQLPDSVEFWHEGRCGRCGRTLTVPESIASGLGPVCAGRVAA